jgi:hypothetical protein
MALHNTPKPIAAFRGLNNVVDPMSLDWSWFTRADNIVITGAGKIQRAPGYTKRVNGTAITGAFSSEDLSRLYVVDNGALLKVNADYTTATLASTTSTDPVRGAEVNNIIYYSNGTDLGSLEPAGWRRWGIALPGTPALSAGSGALPAGAYQVCCTLTDDRGMEGGNGEIAVITVGDAAQIAISAVPQVTGYTTNVYVTGQNADTFKLLATASPAAVTYNNSIDELGVELPFLFCGPPRGSFPAYFAGRMYLAEPFPQQDVSVIWRSWPQHYHLFDYGNEAVTVPGTVLMLAATKDALIIGTDAEIYALDQSDGLTSLAPYGAVPGDHVGRLGNSIYFWTLRGLAEAMPFRNLTEGTLSVAPGLSAGGRIVEQSGFRRYMVALHSGGEAYNARS